MFNGYKLCISGDLGSGKSTVAKYLIEKYGFETFATGAYQREMAKRLNMTTLELNKYAETHPEIDREIDGKLTEVGREEGNKIFDSRMAWHFVENSFKVYLQCDLDVAASRIFNDSKRGKTEAYSSIEHAKQFIVDRRSSEIVRYKEKYDADIMDMNNYDLVLDASYDTPEVIAEKLYSEMKKFYENMG